MIGSRSPVPATRNPHSAISSPRASQSTLWTRWLPLLSLLVTLTAWLFPHPSFPKLIKPLLVAYVLAATSVLLFFSYIVRLLTKLGAGWSPIIITLVIYSSSLTGLGLSLNYIRDDISRRPTKPRFDGRMSFLEYCQRRYGTDAALSAADSASCQADGITHAFTPMEICYWEFGSAANVAEPLSLGVICDTSARTDPPCKDDQRYCGAEKEYCCPP